MKGKIEDDEVETVGPVSKVQLSPKKSFSNL